MALAKYDSSFAYDQVLKRGIPGQVAKVVDAETGIPVEGIQDLEGRPIPALVSNSQGYLPPFQVEGGPSVVQMQVGSVSYILIDYLLVGDSATAAQDAAAAAQQAASLVEAPADEVVSTLVQGDTLTQTAGDARWVTNDGVDNTVSALFDTQNSAVQATADARYTKRGELTVNVADFGAVGDGTDETAKFQAAFDYVQSLGGGEVFVPLPTFGQPYRVGKFYFPRDFRLRSAPGVVYKRIGLSWGGINRPANTAVSPLSGTSDPYSGYGNIEIIGGTWDGAVVDETYVPTGFNCFFFQTCRSVLIENVTVKDLVTNHALDINGVEGLKVRNCRFLGYIDATTDSSRGYVEAIQIGPFEDTVAAMGTWVLDANGAASRNIPIEGCTFGASGTPGTQAFPTGVGNHGAINRSRGLLTGGINITDCDFNGCTYIGVTVYTWDNVNIFKNRFTDCKLGIRANNFTSAKRWDTTLRDWVTAPSRENPTDLRITDNSFTNSIDGDISVLGTAVGSDGAWGYISDIHITGNTRTRTIAGRSTNQFIRLMLCKNVTVSQNTGGQSSVGIEAAACQGVMISRNRINETSNYGIKVDNTNAVPDFQSANARAENNVVTNAGSHGIGINATLGFEVISNKVIDAGRLSGGASILLSGSDAGLVSTNSITASSLPFNLDGIGAGGTTNTSVTLDNRIEGVTNRLVSLTGSGTSYGNIQYT